MKFKKLQEFMEDCHAKGVELPNGLQVIVDDYEENVPEDYREQGWVEYNHTHADNRSSRVEMYSGVAVQEGMTLLGEARRNG